VVKYKQTQPCKYWPCVVAHPTAAPTADTRPLLVATITVPGTVGDYQQVQKQLIRNALKKMLARVKSVSFRGFDTNQSAFVASKWKLNGLPAVDVMLRITLAQDTVSPVVLHNIKAFAAFGKADSVLNDRFCQEAKVQNVAVHSRTRQLATAGLSTICMKLDKQCQKTGGASCRDKKGQCKTLVMSGKCMEKNSPQHLAVTCPESCSRYCEALFGEP
jgi:hypothetical protein